MSWWTRNGVLCRTQRRCGKKVTKLGTAGREVRAAGGRAGRGGGAAMQFLLGALASPPGPGRVRAPARKGEPAVEGRVQATGNRQGPHAARCQRLGTLTSERRHALRRSTGSFAAGSASSTSGPRLAAGRRRRRAPCSRTRTRSWWPWTDCRWTRCVRRCPHSGALWAQGGAPCLTASHWPGERPKRVVCSS